MKVIMTLDSLGSEDGGPSRSVPALVTALTEGGTKTELWCLAGEEKVAGICIRRFETVNAMVAALQQEDLMGLILHDNGLWRVFCWKLGKAARKLGIPFVISPRGMLEPWSLQQGYWKKKLAWWGYQGALTHGAALLHATSQLEAENMRKLQLKNPITIQPNGVDLPKLGEPSAVSPKKVIYLSRLHKKKGIEMLLQAWAKLGKTDWTLQIAGNGESSYKSGLLRLATELGIHKSVEWLGELDDSRKWIALTGADFFVLPSYSENFGIVVAEALASGLPAITTTGTPWQGLEEHGCGLWVAPEVDALTNAILAYMEMPHSDRVNQGLLGRKWMESHFSWKSVANGMAQAYQAILERKGLEPYLNAGISAL